MSKKSKIEVDEELMRQMIAGQVPITTNVVREIPAKEEVQTEIMQAAVPEAPIADNSTFVCAAVPEPRRRRTMVIPDFEQTYMNLMDIRIRAALYVSIETKRKILEVVKKIGGEYMTATSYVENILRQHLEIYKEDINRIYKEQSSKNLL